MSNALSAILFLATLSSDDYCTAQLDHQLAWHREYGLPLPPPQASLVWFVTEPREVIKNGKQVTEPGEPGLDFSLDGRTLCTWKSLDVASITFIKPDPSFLRDGIYVSSLGLAVACHERGWKQMALAAIRKWTRDNKGWDTEGAIASDAWHHWERRIHNDPGTPLSVLAKYLRRARLLHGGDEELIRSVELACQPRNSPPGSDDALIDELIHLTGGEPNLLYWWDRGYRSDPRYQAIVQRGLEIVPALIAHLDDQRITRGIRRLPGLDNRENLRVHDVVVVALCDLHGGTFVIREDTREELLKAIGNWYADAHKLGEGNYVASCILGADEDDRDFRPALFWLLTEKHPERVPGVYRALIDTRPGHRGFAWQYAKAIAEGPLLPAEKRAILEYAAIQNSPNIRWGGIKYLRTVDPKLAHGILLSVLANLPAEADWDEVLVAGVAAECADVEEWRALALAVRRADPGGRLELLRAIARAKAPEGRRHRLALLAEYLTDDAVRDANADRDRFRWSRVAGDGFTRLEVRNFAALQLAPLLQIEADQHRDQTPEQWAELREKVRAAVAKELRR